MEKFLVCLTGGIASGKTHVSDHLHKLGAGVIDTDVLARQVVRPGSVGLQQLFERFGSEILTSDQTLDRARLKQIIFRDEQARLAANQILHPLIWQVGQQQAAASPHPLEVWVIPLYRPDDTAMEFDRVLVIDVHEVEQISRVQQRDSVDHAMAQSIVNSQLPRKERLQLATDVLVNNGTRQALDEKIRQVHALFSVLMAAKQSPVGR